MKKFQTRQYDPSDVETVRKMQVESWMNAKKASNHLTNEQDLAQKVLYLMSSEEIGKERAQLERDVQIPEYRFNRIAVDENGEKNRCRSWTAHRNSRRLGITAEYRFCALTVK